MRTTIDLPDPLLQEAKALASKRKTSLRAVVVSALRDQISKEKTAKPFTLNTLTAGSPKARVTTEEINQSIRSLRDSSAESWSP